MIVAALLLLAAPARVLSAEGHWAALQRADGCEAASAALAPARAGRPQPRFTIHFDARRDGQVAILLSDGAKAGGSVMLTVGERPFLLVGRGAMAWSTGPGQQAALIDAMRGAGGMRVEARRASGGRIVDRYALDGAATAIDAAAACASRLAKR